MVDERSREEFLKWSEVKISLHNEKSKKLHVRSGEVWWASLGKNIGSEMDGKGQLFERPVVILRWASATTLLALPVTSKIKHDFWDRVMFKNKDGFDRDAVITQLRLISVNRLHRKIEKIPHDVLIRIKKAINNFIEN